MHRAKVGDLMAGPMIPYSDCEIDQADISEVVAVLKKGYVSSLPKIREFEEKMAKEIGVKYAIALNSGTAALHACMFAIGIGNGDEVITSPITFAATSNSVLYMSGKPVFSDIDSKTYNLDPRKFGEKITSKTKAVVPVHYTGQPCDMDEIMKIAREKNIVVIEDAAHALGATYKGKMAGTFGDAAILSFHPVKHITTYEGGMVVTNNEEICEKIKLFRSHGITRDKAKMGFGSQVEGEWVSDQVCLGYNYRMTDMQAALGVSQLKKLGKFLKLRREYAAIYSEAFEKLDFVEPPHQLKGTDSAWHLYVLKFSTKKLGISRAAIFEKLRKAGVGVWVHYPPVYYSSYYQKLGYRKGLCKNAEELYDQILSIPLFPKMSVDDVNFVIKAVSSLRD